MTAAPLLRVRPLEPARGQPVPCGTKGSRSHVAGDFSDLDGFHRFHRFPAGHPRIPLICFLRAARP